MNRIVYNYLLCDQLQTLLAFVQYRESIISSYYIEGATYFIYWNGNVK